MLKIFTAEADKYHEVCERQVMIPPNAPFCWESEPPIYISRTVVWALRESISQTESRSARSFLRGSRC